MSVGVYICPLYFCQNLHSQCVLYQLAKCLPWHGCSWLCVRRTWDASIFPLVTVLWFVIGYVILTHLADGRTPGVTPIRPWRPTIVANINTGQPVNSWDSCVVQGGSQPGVQKVGTAGTAGAGQITFGWTKWDLDAEKNWTYYGKSKEILPHSDKLDIWIFNKWYKHLFQ
jgi:hypothetical protein